MAYDNFELPSINRHSDSDAFSWYRFRQCLDEHRKDLEQTCEEKGPDAANIAREKLMEGMNDRALIDRMCLEAQWRNPRAIKIIRAARGSYCSLMFPLQTAEERQHFEMLRAIHETLKEILEKLQKGESIDHPFDLERMLETVEFFNDFAQGSEEAQNLINNIIHCINQLAILQGK